MIIPEATMLSEIIEAERSLHALLPALRKAALPLSDIRAVAGFWSARVWSAAVQLGPMPLSGEQIGRGMSLARHPVFICGTHRSGTTLLRDVLDGHPDLVVLPSEGTYYTHIETKLKRLDQAEWMAFITQEWIRRLANPINQAPYWIIGHSQQAGSPYIDFARYVQSWWKVIPHIPGTQWPHMAIILAYASCTNQLSARSWVEKTPTNERFLHRIRTEMPGAKIIHILRNPMSTLISHKRMAPMEGLWQPLQNIKHSFHIAREQQKQQDPQFLLLNYEELCAEFKISKQKIIRFLDIPSHAMLHTPTVGGVPSRANSSFNKQAGAGALLQEREHRPDAPFSKAEEQLIAACLGHLATTRCHPIQKINAIRQVYIRTRYWIFYQLKKIQR